MSSNSNHDIASRLERLAAELKAAKPSRPRRRTNLYSTPMQTGRGHWRGVHPYKASRILPSSSTSNFTGKPQSCEA